MVRPQKAGAEQDASASGREIYLPGGKRERGGRRGQNVAAVNTHTLTDNAHDGIRNDKDSSQHAHACPRAVRAASAHTSARLRHQQVRRNAPSTPLPFANKFLTAIFLPRPAHCVSPDLLGPVLPVSAVRLHGGLADGWNAARGMDVH